MKKLLILALIILVSAFSFPQGGNISVTFQVDMSVQIIEGNFVVGTCSAVVRGDFQMDAGDTLGNWQGNIFQLNDEDGDSIFTGTFSFTQNFAGTVYNFEYVIVSPGNNDLWENTPPRQFTLNPPAVINPVVYFNNDPNITIITEVTNTLNFTADISSILSVGINNAFDPFQDSLLVMGLDWDNLGKNVAGNRRMTNTDPNNPGIYTTSLTVTSGSASPNGVGDSTRWKFKAYPDNRFMNSGWELGNDRWHVYEADGSIINLPTIVPRILPVLDTLNHTVDLTINVDMTGAHNIYNGEPIPINSIENVIITGSAQFLGMYGFNHPWPPYPCYCIDDTAQGYIKVLTHSNGNIWTLSTTIPIGQPGGVIEYQFGVTYPGYDTINGGNATILNELDFPDSHLLILLNSSDSIVINNHFGDLSTLPGVEKIENLIPASYTLEQNYPNPFNPGTKIRFGIPELANVRLTVYNLLGEEISTLVNGEHRAGVYEATFNALNLPSGIYFYALQTDKFSTTNKMLLLK